MSERPRLIGGILVGGASRRMGGRPKGLLPAPGPAPGEVGGPATVIERTIALVRVHCDEVVLVGRAEAYASLGMDVIADATKRDGTQVEGPLAGLVALLELAKGANVVAVACDMPYLTGAMVAHLATFAPDAAAVAPRVSFAPDGAAGQGSAWSPFFARYGAEVAVVARAALERGEGSLRVILDAVGTHPLPLSPDEESALRDWDAPEDVDDVAARSALS